MSRRRFLALTGGATAGVAAGGIAGCGSPETELDSPIVEFHGDHQAGIVTPAQDRLHLAAFDVTTDSRSELIDLLRRWTEAARLMTAGAEVGTHGATGGPYAAPPDDTGEALGLSAAHLTLTFGFGPTLFATPENPDRFGLATRRPAELEELPHFPGDALDPARSGGDLCVQACADDPQVAVHAIRNLVRLGFGTGSVRWSQLGFGRTSSTSAAQTTARNLFGFKDGTNNLKAQDQTLLDEFVWVPADGGHGWMSAGTYMVVRRISMNIETWDRTSLQEQEGVIGRDKRDGAPLSGGTEFAAPDFIRAGSNGAPLIPSDSHLRLAHPTANDGSRILRRGYNFTDGSDGLGHLDAGLLFIAYTSDPGRHYVPMQNRLARHDALSEYLRHTGSAIFAVPRGLQPDTYIGQDLFDT